MLSSSNFIKLADKIDSNSFFPFGSDKIGHRLLQTDRLLSLLRFLVKLQQLSQEGTNVSEISRLITFAKLLFSSSFDGPLKINI